MKDNIQNQMPTSPHLWIYKWQINMVLSICHRISGVFLYIFLLKIIWIFSLNIIYPESPVVLFCNEVLKSVYGKIAITFMSFLFYYHLFNGIRHLFWDMGTGFEIKTMQFTSILVLFCTFILTGITGFMIFAS
jgi:succinate dehydrogenase / fumarate reductase cytochrome b subunit